MLVYEMKPICYNMYKWGGANGRAGAITEKRPFTSIKFFGTHKLCSVEQQSRSFLQKRINMWYISEKVRFWKYLIFFLKSKVTAVSKNGAIMAYKNNLHEIIEKFHNASFECSNKNLVKI